VADVESGVKLLVCERDTLLLEGYGDDEGRFADTIEELEEVCDREDGRGMMEVNDGITESEEPDIWSSWKNEVYWL